MKAVGVISTTVLFLLVGYAVPAFAQDEHHEDAKPEHQEEKAKPAQHEEQAKPGKQQEQAKPEEHQAQAQKQEPQTKPAKQEEQAKPAKREEQAKSDKQEPKANPVKQEEAKPGKQQEGNSTRHEQQAKGQEQANSNNHQRPERNAAEEQHQREQPALRLSARGEGRIPEDRFRANFGEGHRFVIREPVMVGGYSRFQYSGFWFGFVNPWPVDCYYTDDVYVDYIDGGYYLCNPYYPGERISISVVM
jgi:outer membrane biosynthesis protein TonB